MAGSITLRGHEYRIEWVAPGRLEEMGLAVHGQAKVRTPEAPFAGIVVAKNAQPGEMISPAAAGGGFTRTGNGTIVDMASLEIEVDVNEAYINRVRPGQRVEVRFVDRHLLIEVIALPLRNVSRAAAKDYYRVLRDEAIDVTDF